jgi:pimeloyl-ACP methyl ester carboxylesterase
MFDPRRPAASLLQRFVWLTAALASVACASSAMAAFETTKGILPDGTAYRIDFPDHWNGTVLIGLDYAGRDPMIEGDANAANRQLIEQGFAMAGTTRLVTGWAIHLAAANAIRTLDLFEAKYGKARHAIQFGNSQGGHTAAVSMQAYPQRWDGALIQCGGLSGAVGQWQGKFDALFAAKTLLAPDAADSSLPVIHVPQDWQTTALPAWKQMLEGAEKTPAGQARIALAAMLGQLPAWADRNQPQPQADDLNAQASGLADSLIRNLLNQAMSSRAQLEKRSGGNITSNVGMDYAKALAQIDQEGLIARLYQKAGLNLQDDLVRLAQAPRVSADPDAIAFVATGVFDGNLQAPVLTVNGIGDPISTVASQQIYGATVKAAGKEALLRQVYTASAGHCGFTPAESVAAVQTLMRRINTGTWPATDAVAMNQAAAATGLGLAPGAARFIPYTPRRFERAYGACDLERDLKASTVAPVRAEGQALPVCRK